MISVNQEESELVNLSFEEPMKKKKGRQEAYNDSCERNEVEGRFGTGKRKYTLDCIMAKLKETSETMIILNLMVMDLDNRLRLLLFNFQRWVLLGNIFHSYMAIVGILWACILKWLVVKQALYIISYQVYFA